MRRWLLTLFALFAVCVPLATASSRLSGPSSYTGILKDTGGGTVEIKVRKRNFNPLLVRVRDVLLQCDDGIASPQTFRLQGDVSDDGTIRIQKYYTDEFIRSYIEFSGRVDGPKAKGIFYYLSATTGSNDGDCSTLYPKRWRAQAERP